MIPGEKNKKAKEQKKPEDSTHLGSSNAFSETETPFSRDEDDISDERLDDWDGKEDHSISGKLVSD